MHKLQRLPRNFDPYGPPLRLPREPWLRPWLSRTWLLIACWPATLSTRVAYTVCALLLVGAAVCLGLAYRDYQRDPQGLWVADNAARADAGEKEREDRRKRRASDEADDQDEARRDAEEDERMADRARGRQERRQERAEEAHKDKKEADTEKKGKK